jgi:hypothetical protein
MKTIDSSEISIVIQGRFNENCQSSSSNANTEDVIKAWRKLLPKAQIILSTWEQPKCSLNEVDILIVNQDPGVTISKCSEMAPENNLGRQILSTQTGLRAARKFFSIKTRTDIMPFSDGFVSIFLKNRARNINYCIFDSPVVTCRFCTLDPVLSGLSLHVSDIFHFGKSTDLQKIWEIPIPKPCSGQNPADVGFDRLGRIITTTDRLLRPEQYITLNLIRMAAPEINLEYTYDDNLRARSEGECYIFNNFTIRDASEIGINLPERMVRSSFQLELYSNRKIFINEIKWATADFSREKHQSNWKDWSSYIYEYWRSTPENIRIPSWIAAIVMVIQNTSILWKPKKLKRWIQYRRRGRALKDTKFS